MLNPSGSAYLYSYTNPMNMLAAVSTDSLQYVPSYDGYGNTLSTITRPMNLVYTPENGKNYHLFNASTSTLITTYDCSMLIAQQYLPEDSAISQWTVQYHNATEFSLCRGNSALTINTTVWDPLERVTVTAYTGADNQRFILADGENGTVIIKPKGLEYALSIDVDEDGSTAVTVTPIEGDVKLIQKWYVYEPVNTDAAFIKSTATYSENGNLPATATDALGNTTHYSYNAVKGLLNTLTDALGNTTAYTYNTNNDRLTAVTAGGQQVSYTYDNRDRLTRITTASGYQYDFWYTNDNQISMIHLKEANVEDLTYGLVMRLYDEYGRLTTQRYSTDESVTYTYDALDRVTSIAYNDSETAAVEYAYDKSGQLCAVIDHCAGTTTRYVYDLSGRVTEETEYTRASLNATGIAHQTTYTYDAKTGQLTAVTRDGVTESYEYGSMADGKSPETVYVVSRNNQTQWQYTYDALGRRVTSTLAPLGKTTTYTYQNGGHGVNSTSTQLATETTDGVTTAYTYDAVGNITAIHKDGVLYESYQYDSLGQLTRVTRQNGESYVYTYGNNGNLSEVRKNGEVIKTYAYDTEWWKDQLTSFNGNAITYDNIGNPLTYHNGASLSWDRRQLLSYTHDGTTVAFTYDSVGNRLSKTVGNTATNYVYVGGRLEKQTTGTSTLAFLYDEVGAVYGFTYNGTAYYYERNIQGDVLGIYDSTGTKLVTYTYDAWGALLDMTDTSTNNIGTINPIRYRSYYYDAETGWYYLSTRYYDPQMCRFVNADGYVSTGQGILGNNMFAYCLNNPVNMFDPNGTVCHILMGGRSGPSCPYPISMEKCPVCDVKECCLPEGYASSENLTDAQMRENAQNIYCRLSNAGWSKEAICAVLGNMQVESVSLNPGRQQYGGGPGYGLVQWDPATKYTRWASANGYANDSLTGQVNYLIYSMKPGRGEWFKNPKHPDCYLSYNNFTTSTTSVAYLTEVFLWSYERPAISHIDRRIECATHWFNHLGFGGEYL